MSATVFIATSLDGFIARTDGTFDWLPPPAADEDYGFGPFMESVDALVIGRKTYETALGLGGWPYGKRLVIVLSGRPIDFTVVKGANVEQMSGEPAEIIAKLAARDVHRLYVDGGLTIQRFLRAGCIDRIIITRVPILLGGGIPLFGTLARDLPLRHVSTKSYPSGLVQSEYVPVASASPE
jgi:dihydrofolate reductase